MQKIKSLTFISALTLAVSAAPVSVQAGPQYTTHPLQISFVKETVKDSYYLLGYSGADIELQANQVVLLRNNGKNAAAFKVSTSIDHGRKLFQGKLIKKYDAYGELQPGGNYSSVVYIMSGSSAGGATAQARTDTRRRESRESRKSAPPGMSNRTIKRFGIDGSIGGSEPFFGFMGANLSYNILDYLRVRVGYGMTPISSTTITSMGGGVAVLWPGWNLAPFVGLNYHIVGFDITGMNDALLTVFGVPSTLTGKASMGIVSIPLGIDWQAASGFHAALLTSFVSAKGATTTTGTLAGGFGPAGVALEAGWYF